MAVRFVVGRGNRGKTRWVFKDIKDRLENTVRDKLILIVPDQFTLQAERDLIQYLGTPGIMRIEVLSFTRLAYKVFNEAGGITRIPINEQGKSMMIRKILNEMVEDLSIYQNSAGQEGFISKYVDLLSIFKKNNVTPEQLSTYENSVDQRMVKEKLRDIRLIYEKFIQASMDSYMDSDDAMGMLLEKLGDTGFLRDTYIWIDGFSHLSKQIMGIILGLMDLAKDLVITFPMDTDGGARDRELFMLPSRMAADLYRGAEEKGLERGWVDLNTQENPSVHREIRHLEKELFAYPYHAYSEEVEGIEIFKAANIYSEIEYMASKVVELARERNYRWRDMAIVCNDLDSYGSMIKRTLDEYGIPYFLDQKRSIMNNPIIEFILSSIQAIIRGYPYEVVSRVFKTGFSPLSVEEYEKLEIYILQHGIRGSRWKRPFEGEDVEVIRELNQSRDAFITPLLRMDKKCKGRKSIREISKNLYEYLEDVNLRERLEQWIETLREEGQYEYVYENTQIWNILMETLDQLVEILGEQRVTLKEYASILQSGFSSYRVGIIPTTLDQVLVGQIQRSKSHTIKALFVVGVNDGVLPSGLDEEDILSNDEKIMLKEKGLDLAWDYETQFQQESHLIYSTLSKPQDYLWLSYSLADGEGRALRPSNLLDRVKKIFPRITETSELVMDEALEKRLISTPQGTFKHLVENLRRLVDGHEIHGMWLDSYHWYYHQSQWRDLRRSMIQGLFHHNQTEEVGREQAKWMYSYPIRTSVSRLENFVRCPFSHFIKYGLRPKEIKEYKVEAPDIGLLFHDSIALFTEELNKDKLDWTKMDRETTEELVERVIDGMVVDYGEGVFQSTHRYRYLVNRLKRVSKRAVWTLTSHLKQGEFQFMGHELVFGRGGHFPPLEVELADGSRIYLEGRIDRIDILEGEEEDYIKIIDYKSGDRDLKLADIYHGLNLQLILYLHAIMKNMGREKTIKPAGIFYYRIDDPMVQSDERVVEVVEEEIERQLKMKGLVLKDVNIVRALDGGLDQHSKIIPVGLTKDNQFYKYSSALEEEGFYALIRHANELIRQISEEMLKGVIRIYPVKQGKRTACDYCSYRGICQFDTLFEDNEYHAIGELKDEEVLERLKEKGVSEHGTMDPKPEGGDL